MDNMRNFVYFFLALSLLLLISYFNLGSVGFYLDDYSSIVYNPTLKSPIDFLDVIEKHTARMVSYLMLAVQNQLFGGDPSGFHYLGLAVHFFISLLLFLFIEQLLKVVKYEHPTLLAAISSVIFAIHPQNSQAVVYIVQQTAMYAALFYLLAMYAYVRVRTATDYQNKVFFSLILVTSSILALFAKQNTVTLPIAILLIEWCFFKRYTKKLLLLYIGGVFTCLLGLSLINSFNIEQVLTFVSNATIENKLIPREDYFFTQIGVVSDYISQFFYPINFRLEFDYQVTHAIKYVTFYYLSVHTALIFLAFYYRRTCSIITFGILFYYLAHSVESSLIPITDLAFEHRTYLPNVGLIIATIVFSSVLINKIATERRKTFVHLSIVFIVVFGLTYQTHMRVNQWADPKAFYQNEVELSPNSPRAYTDLAKIYIEEGNCPLAIGVSEHAINLYEKQRASGLTVQPEFYQNYILCLRRLKIYDKADYFEQYLLSTVHEPIRRSFILFQRGSFMLEQQRFKEAEKYLTESIKLNGKNYNTAINLAITKVQLGNRGHAIKLLEHAVALRPQDQKIRALLAKIINAK